MLCSVIVPVYNEEKTITAVIEDLNSLSEKYPLEIVVVESNSTDQTRSVLISLRQKYSFELILQDEPRGKGNAFIQALNFINGEVVAIVDGDREYLIADLLKLLDPIMRKEADFVLGNRHVKGMPMRIFPGRPITSAYFNIGHEFFTKLFNKLYGTKLRDPATMWKVFRRTFIEDYTFVGQRFEIDWEIMALLTRRRAFTIEIPINYVSRGKEDGKKIRAFRDPIRWLFWIVRFRFKKMSRTRDVK